MFVDEEIKKRKRFKKRGKKGAANGVTVGTCQTGGKAGKLRLLKYDSPTYMVIDIHYESKPAIAIEVQR